MTASPSPQNRLRVAHLNPRAPTPFALQPDEATRAAIAQELELSDLPKLEFTGEIRAEGGDAWHLTGQLKARVVQPCVVTLKPVKTSLNETVERHYSRMSRCPRAKRSRCWTTVSSRWDSSSTWLR